MVSETGMQQQYCLRWNNYTTNLLTVFGELLRNEDFTDVTLACEGGPFIKCHKMVLAACSSYFQYLFSDLPCRHPVVVLKDVRYTEIRAILEFMYKGEVSVTHEEVEPLLKVAEALKVKGLVGDNYKENAIRTASSFGVPSTRENMVAEQAILRRNSPSPNDFSNSGNVNDASGRRSESSGHSSNGGIKTENNENLSPPHSTSTHLSFQKAPYFQHGKSAPDKSVNHLSLPIWPMAGLPIAAPPTTHTASASMFGTCYEAVIAAGSTDSIALMKKKKGSNFYANRDTPILRTVLGQGQPDSSQPMSLVCHNEGQDQTPQSNGPTTPQDGSYNIEVRYFLFFVAIGSNKVFFNSSEPEVKGLQKFPLIPPPGYMQGGLFNKNSGCVHYS